MAGTMSRKQFFQTALFQAAQVTAELTQTLSPSLMNKQEPVQYAFEADFPQELLAEEAKNMGLDPYNREEVLAAIAEKLKPPKS